MRDIIRLTTPVELPKGMPPITHDRALLLMGSCFAENIGALLTNAAFRTDVNPFGILYNPSSLSEALRQLLTGKVYTENDLFYFREQWHSPMHHGSFSRASATETLLGINTRLQQARERIAGTDLLMLTWGTAHVYRKEGTESIVSNCHKLPEREFIRRRLTVEEIVTDYTELLESLWQRNPSMKVLLTVSPIRHARDGMHANQLSKATLLLATERLQEAFPGRVVYFPSYEIVMDELRDYRYYADDLLHPSPLAVNYIWQRFGETFFSKETAKLATECEDINKALQHRPLHAQSEEYKRFLGQIVLKIERLKEKYPYLELEKPPYL